MAIPDQTHMAGEEWPWEAFSVLETVTSEAAACRLVLRLGRVQSDALARRVFARSDIASTTLLRTATLVSRIASTYDTADMCERALERE